MVCATLGELLPDLDVYRATGMVSTAIHPTHLTGLVSTPSMTPRDLVLLVDDDRVVVEGGRPGGAARVFGISHAEAGVAGGQRLEGRARQLLVIAHLEELAGGEGVAHLLLCLGLQHLRAQFDLLDLVLLPCRERKRSEPGDLHIQRHLALPHGEVAQRVYQDLCLPDLQLPQGDKHVPASWELGTPVALVRQRHPQPFERVGGRWRGLIQGRSEGHVEGEPPVHLQEREGRLAPGMPGLRTGQGEVERDLNYRGTIHLPNRQRAKVGNQPERGELDQGVEAKVGLNTDGLLDFGDAQVHPHLKLCVEVHAGTELRRVGGEGEVRLEAQAGVIACRQCQGQAIQRREGRRGLEARVEATCGQREGRARAPARAQRHIAREREDGDA